VYIYSIYRAYISYSDALAAQSWGSRLLQASNAMLTRLNSHDLPVMRA
jgi:hypothetical protein